MILTVAVPTPLRRLFDYLPPASPTSASRLVPGVRVRVDFGNRQMVGLIVAAKGDSDHPDDKLKPILEVIDGEPLLPRQLLDLYLWAAGYYQHPAGDALFSALPALLRRGEPVPERRVEFWQLTNLGQGLGEQSLKRARKQRELVTLLKARHRITAEEAAALGLQRSVFRSLREKGLVESLWVDSETAADGPLLASPHLPLREEQRQVLDSLDLHNYGTTLLFGDTGTGKTEVYLQAIEKVLEAGGQALVLVPEINLTPQILSRFRQRFRCPIQAIHSGLTDRERLQAWADGRAGRARIIIGTRSAIFTPMPRLGIIILDEEHDPSFKQQEGFRYSARDVAVMRASREGIPLILGSATPSLESLHNCRTGRYRLRELRERGHSNPPQWQLVDVRGTELRGGLATATIQAINRHLGAGSQVLVFLNRRGYAPLMLCHDCGWQATCDHCSTRLTAHLGSRRLVCHHCEKQRRLPATCPSCGGSHLLFSGQGTERCQETLTELFRGYPVIRIDRDSTRRKGTMDSAIQAVNSNRPCILLGTQMLAKGHHFPGVTLAVLLDVDGGLFSTDFRAIERTAQLIIQVAGRAGRGEAPGHVLMQSHYCDHPIVADLVRGDYREFASRLLAERETMQLPPYSHLALFRCDARDAAHSEEFLRKVRRLAEPLMRPAGAFGFLGPLPGAIEKRRDQFRFTLLINSVNRARLANGLSELCRLLDEDREARRIKWSLDVDPQDMT